MDDETLITNLIAQTRDRAPGLPADAIDTWESEHGVRFPPALRSFFLAQNGMDSLFPDHDSWFGSIRWWPLEEVVSMEDYSAGSWVPEALGPPTEFFVFADFLIHSWTYAIRLRPDGSDGPVIWDGGDHVYVLAPSFHEFVARCLDAPDSIVSPERYPLRRYRRWPKWWQNRWRLRKLRKRYHGRA